jgi:hypothetical protein
MQSGLINISNKFNELPDVLNNSMETLRISGSYYQIDRPLQITVSNYPDNKGKSFTHDSDLL